MDRCTTTAAAILVIALGLLATEGNAQVDPLATQAEEYYRRALAAWADADIDAIASRQGARVGFGFRGLAPRGVDDSSAGFQVALLHKFFDSMEYYNLRLDEIHTAVHGNVVVAWGFHTEDFKQRGKPPEVHRVRFSFTAIAGEDGQLRQVLSHRDIQPFDDQGRYIP
jgi:hypothetical protein